MHTAGTVRYIGAASGFARSGGERLIIDIELFRKRDTQSSRPNVYICGSPHRCGGASGHHSCLLSLVSQLGDTLVVVGWIDVSMEVCVPGKSYSPVLAESELNSTDYFILSIARWFHYPETLVKEVFR